MEVNKENLENTLSNSEKPAEVPTPEAPKVTEEAPKAIEAPKAAEGTVAQPETPQMPKETEIGFHQGALNTLAAERMELVKIVQNVEKIMAMHIKRLEELGVKVQTKKE